MSSTNGPEIFLLSLSKQPYFDELYSYLIDELFKLAQLKRAQSPTGALGYLESNTPRAIIITDEGIAQRKNAQVLDKVLSYAQNGGTVIVGLHFTAFTTRDTFDYFFKQGFNLPWTRGDYHRTDFGFNPSTGNIPAGTKREALPAPYSMKVLHVQGARAEEKIYVPITGTMTQSHVFPAERVDESQAAVVGAKIGEGYLVYCGDVNAEEESARVILALCGV